MIKLSDSLVRKKKSQEHRWIFFFEKRLGVSRNVDGSTLSTNRKKSEERITGDT